MAWIMRNQFEVKINHWATRKYFVEGRENGKRSRKFFKTKAEAKEYADLKNIELENHGRAHAEFDSRLRDMAQDCATRLRALSLIGPRLYTIARSPMHA